MCARFFMNGHSLKHIFAMIFYEGPVTASASIISLSHSQWWPVVPRLSRLKHFSLWEGFRGRRITVHCGARFGGVVPPSNPAQCIPFAFKGCFAFRSRTQGPFYRKFRVTLLFRCL